MGVFVKGDAVVLPFAFCDLSSAQRRPAFGIADLTGDDGILCQITTQQRRDGYSIPLTQKALASGGLRHDSNVRTNCLFTADSNMIAYQAGKAAQSKADEVIERVVQIVRSRP